MTNKYDTLSTEEALEKLSPAELIEYMTRSHLDSMSASYKSKLGEDTKRIIAKRELDPTDKSQMQIGREWLDED